MHYKGDKDYSHSKQECIGVLVTNLGTPDAATPAAVRRYLAEFLSDPRIVEMPRWLWKLILHGVILRIRPRAAAHAYQSVWTEQGSPLLVISQQQAKALQQTLQAHFQLPVKVVLAMRYGNPSIASGLEQLHQAGARRILVLPLYPQYSATTTASTFDAIAHELQQWRWLPELRMINHYHDHPDYIGALASSIRHFQKQHGEPEQLLFSFHGLPKRYLLAGDPYYCECHKTARLVAQRLQLEESAWQVTFQSRFGREEWLQPYTDHTLQALPGAGIKHVQLVCPGFSADCLETLEEINMQNREIFLQAGGEQFDYIPALNDHTDHIKMLTRLVCEHTGNWQQKSSTITEETPALARAKGAAQ